MRIIVHIGHYKTGTTSLQRRFSDNRAFLEANGIVYPELTTLINPNGTTLPSHSPLVFALLSTRGLFLPAWYRDLLERAPDPPTLESQQRRLDAAIATARRTGNDLILSSEELMRFGAGGRHVGLVDEFAAMLGDNDVEIFCHLRRPDLHLCSWYNQLVKLGARRPNLSSDIEFYFDKVHVDYAMALRPWVERFGGDRVTVRRYEHRIGDVTDDLLAAYGHHLELPEGTEVWENERFPDVHIELLRAWNDLRAPEALSVRLRRTMTDHATRHELRGVAVEFLTPAARTALHHRSTEVAAALDDLLGARAPAFDDLDAILEPIPDAMTDTAAHQQYGADVLEEAFGESRPAAPESAVAPQDSPQGASVERLRRAGASALARMGATIDRVTSARRS